MAWSLETKVPLPCSLTRRPSATRVATARRMVMLLTPNSSQSRLSDGRRSPCFHTICAMRERRTSAVWLYRVPVPMVSIRIYE